MKVRANGLSLPDLDTLAALETGRYWTPAKRPSEALYRPAVNNGYWAEDIITDGLVLYVPLWLYSGAKFPSVDAYKHTCTVTGATWGLQGRTFDGATTVITVPTNAAFGGTTLSFGGWVKPTSTFLSNYRKIIESSDGLFALYTDITTGKFTGVPNPGLSTTTAVADQWYYVMLTVVGSSAKLYVNGALETTGVASLADSSRSVVIGRRGASAIQYWLGTIGGLFIYNRGLALAEYQHNRNVTRWRYA